MKTFATLAFIGTISAQDLLTYCKDSSQCPADRYKGGCCQEMLIKRIAKTYTDAKVLKKIEDQLKKDPKTKPEDLPKKDERDPVWGNFQPVVFQGQEMVPGTKVQICMNAAMVKCRADHEERDGTLNNVQDL